VGWGRFSAPDQTGPETHPAPYTMGTGNFPMVKRLGRGVDHSPHLSPRLKKEQSYTSTPPLGIGGLLYDDFYCITADTRFAQTSRANWRHSVF
jgi:hypothetical protein